MHRAVNTPFLPPPRDEGPATPAARAFAGRGRIGVYAALGASAGSVPLPWVPEALMRRVRGALAQDLASRHGLSLSLEARRVLSEPSSRRESSRLVPGLMRYFGLRLVVRVLTRFGPVRMAWPLRNALNTFALGHLFERYLFVARAERAVRIDAEEARRLRRAIDGAIGRAISIKAPPADPPSAVDDHREEVTAFVDGLIGLAAEVPNRLLQRLDAAFDELLASRHE